MIFVQDARCIGCRACLMGRLWRPKGRYCDHDGGGLTLVATLIAFKIRTPGRHAKLLLPLQHLLLEIVDKVLCTFLREHLARLVRDVSFFT